MNNKHLLKAAFLCFLVCIACLVLFMQVNCKPKEDSQTCVSMDLAIWIRIDAVENDKGDLMERIDRLARVMDEYGLAVAQVKVYERRQEIMNVRISNKD